MIRKIKEHWKGLLVLLGCFAALQFAPDLLIKIVVITILLIVVGIHLSEIYSERKLKKYVKIYIENLGCEMVSIKAYSAHYGINFIANGQKHYIKCEHGPIFGEIVEWVDGTPEEIIKNS